MGAYHSTYRPEAGRLRAIFIAPTKAQKPFPFTIQRGDTTSCQVGDFVLQLVVRTTN